MYGYCELRAEPGLVAHHRARQRSIGPLRRET